MDKPILMTRLQNGFKDVAFKIIEDVGDFQFIVSAEIDSYLLKVQIPKDFPSAKPGILLRSSASGDVSEIEQLLRSLDVFTTPELIESAVRIVLNNVDPKCKKTLIGEKSQQQKMKTSSQKCASSPSSQSSKLPSMRTAADVIKRIQWDCELSVEDFTVGYLDRFVGVLEKPFYVFTWEKEALTDTDPSILTIPQHRIQYFKYKDVIVWDKNARIDDVFGSTGSKFTIFDIVQQHTIVETESSELEEENDDIDLLAEDADISEKSEEEVAIEEANGRRRPTHFLAIQPTSSSFRLLIGELQQNISSIEPSLSEFLVPISSIHVTLCALKFSTDDHACQELTANFPSNICACLDDERKITFKGIETFNDKVLYIPVVENHVLVRMLDVFSQKLDRYVHKKDIERKLTGHLTILKLPFHATAAQKQSVVNVLKTIKQMWKEDFEFGSEQLGMVHCCRMGMVDKNSTTMEDSDKTMVKQFNYHIVYSLHTTKIDKIVA